jgi:hypothetical protein
MSERSLNILASPGFLTGLLLLLLNDLIFKAQFHNGLTGKLSDVAGLFVFPLFWVALFPRLKLPVYVLTALLFIFWKSVYSQPLIDGWNSLPFFRIERIVDCSDLLALPVLPLSYAYSRAPSNYHVARPALYLIAVVSLFSFTATQYRHSVSYDNEYRFQSSRKELLERMSQLSVNEVSPSFKELDRFDIRFDSCTGAATITVSEKEEQAVIRLKEIDYRCPNKPDRQEMLDYFEKEFISKLKAEPVGKSSQVIYIWPSSP